MTAVEAMMLNRRAIHLDLNPMSTFLINALTCPVELADLQCSVERVKTAYMQHEPTTTEAIDEALKQYTYPKDFVLPKGSDVSVVQDLFSKKQLAQLGFLKHLITQETDNNIRKSLLLAFSSTLNLN